MGDLFVHIGKIKKGSIKIGQSVNLEIDIEKRNNSKQIIQLLTYYMSH